jgi:hypothetical protein
MKSKIVKIFLTVSLSFVILISLGFVVSIKRFSKEQGIKYLKNKYPNAANIQYVGEGHNSSFFVVVDSNYNISSFISPNDFGRPEMKKIK